jgi:hypothetical protein
MWHVRERGELRKRFWRLNLMAKELFEDLGVDARIILQLIFKKCYGSVDSVNVARGRDKRRAVVYSVMNLMVP